MAQNDIIAISIHHYIILQRFEARARAKVNVRTRCHGGLVAWHLGQHGVQNGIDTCVVTVTPCHEWCTTVRWRCV